MRSSYFRTVLFLCIVISAESMPIMPDRRNLFNLIQYSGWFPIEINVPDTISSIGEGVGNIGEGINTIGQGISSNVMNWIQSVPLFNRFTNYFSPRPNTLVVWVPFKRANLPFTFNPFQGSSDQSFVPVYP